jgi:hypothetical protein
MPGYFAGLDGFVLASFAAGLLVRSASRSPDNFFRVSLSVIVISSVSCHTPRQCGDVSVAYHVWQTGLPVLVSGNPGKSGF